MKTTLIWMLLGALIGAVVASFIVPPALSWYTSPGGLPQGAQIQSVVQIPEIIRYATTHLLRGQLIGGRDRVCCGPRDRHFRPRPGATANRGLKSLPWLTATATPQTIARRIAGAVR